MTNKVKPFYIKITDDMTPQMVQDAFDKCVDAGAVANDCIENTAKKNDGWGYFGSIHDWELFGVCKIEGTWLGDNQKYMSCNAAQEITLDQLDEWLGLESKAEWSGEGLPPVGVECEFKKYYQNKLGFVKCFIVGETKDKEWLVIHDYADDELHFANKRTRSFEFRPIESPEQKAERERLEAAYDLYCYAKKESVYSCVIVSFKEFIGDFSAREREEYLAIVDKTNYRKQ